MTDLHDRIVVVTGGYGEIAGTIARALLGRGARVVLLGRDPDKGAAAVAALDAQGPGRATFVAADVTVPDELDRAADDIEARIGPVAGLVVNAATAMLGAAFDHDEAQWRRTMAVNLDGAFWSARAFGRAMRDRGGAIVMVSSIAARIDTTPARHIAYGVSKAGMSRLAELLATEWAEYGIRVNAVEPGHVETGKTPFIRRRAPRMVEKWAADAPIGRLIQPADVAATIAFLLADEAAAITGATIPVDGGYAKTK